MVRHTDMEMMIPRNRSRAGPRGNGTGSVRSRRGQSRAWPRVFMGVLLGRSGQGRVGSLSWFRLDSLNNFDGLWTIGVVPGCPGPDTRVT